MPSDRYKDSHCIDEVVVGPPYNSSLFSIRHHVPSHASSYAGTSASRILVEDVFQGPYFRKHFEGYQTKAPIYAGIWSVASSKVLCRYHNPDELSHQKVVPIYIYSLTNIRFVIITLERSNGRLVFILESKTAQNGLHVAWVIKRTSPNRCSVQKRDILLTFNVLKRLREMCWAVLREVNHYFSGRWFLQLSDVVYYFSLYFAVVLAT